MSEQVATGARRTRMTAEQRRESILVAATEVFAEVGYQRGKTSAVAHRIGVSEPVIFQNFGTKAALFAAVVHRAADQVCAWLAGVAARMPVVELLSAMLDPRHLEQVHAAGSIGAIFADAASVTGEPEIEAAARESTRRLAEAVAVLLERGRAVGELRADLDTEAAAWWLMSLVASQRFRRATATDPADIEARLAASTFAFLAGPASGPRRASGGGRGR
jgi:AcrR family transcriptional regulator